MKMLLVLLLAAPGLRAQWGPDVRMTNNNYENYTCANNGRCIVTGTGQLVHFVYSGGTAQTGNFEIFYFRSTDAGVTWAAPLRLTNDISSSQGAAICRLDSRLHVVWLDFRDRNYEIYYKRSTNEGLDWGADVRLSNDPGFSQNPCVAAAGATIHVVWDDQRTGNVFDLFYRRSTDYGTTWNSEVRLTDVEGHSMGPSIAAAGDLVHVVWTDMREGDKGEIYYKRSTDRGASWSADIRLTDGKERAIAPCLALSGSNVYIVYYDWNWSPYPDIAFKRSPDNGENWEAAVRVTSTDDQPTVDPSIAVDGVNLHVTWSQNFFDNYEICYAQSRDSGSTWSNPVRLTNAPNWSYFASVAAANNVAHVAWYDMRSGTRQIYYKRNPNAVGINEPTRQPTAVQSWEVLPNPFVGQAAIRAGAEAEFDVYDARGCWVGVPYHGRVGDGLEPGVYYVRDRRNSTGPKRIVKVR